MAECKISENLKHCTCSYVSCSKRGVCCDCVKSHRSQGQLPGCYFPPDAEKTGERSIEAFVKLVKERGPWW